MEDTNRLSELIVLKEISEILNEGTNLNCVLQDSLEKLLLVTGYRTGWIFMIDEEGRQILTADKNLPPALSHNECSLMCTGNCWCMDKYNKGTLNQASNIMGCKRLEMAISLKTGDTFGLTHHASVPLRSGNDQFGILNVASPSRKTFKIEELTLLESVAYQIGNTIKRIRLTEKQREIALIEERNRLAKDLHDSVNQRLFSINLMAKAGTMIVEKEKVQTTLTQIQEQAMQAQAEMKALIWQLRPKGLENGLIHALSEYGKMLGLNMDTHLKGVVILPAKIEETVWRIGQEALNNCKKHSGEVNVFLSIELSENLLYMKVSDCGSGFYYDPSLMIPTLGLRSMRERTEKLGGIFQLFSTLNSGTTVEVSIPF